MKNGLETQAKPAHFHWVFGLNTVTQHSYAPPVVCSELFVIVSIKSWSLSKNSKVLIKRW